MSRLIDCAAAAILAVALTACEGSGTGGGFAAPAATNTTATSAAPAIPEGPVPSPYLLDAVKEAAPDPVAALPEQVKPVPFAGTWDAELVGRIGDLAYTALGLPGDEAETAASGVYAIQNETIEFLPAALQLAGAREQAKRLVPASDGLQPLEECLQKSRQDTDTDTETTSLDGCNYEVTATMASALTRLGAGDRAQAETIYQTVIRDWPLVDADIQKHCYQDLPGAGRFFFHQGCQQYEERAAYDALTDRPDDVAASSHAARALATHPTTAEDQGDLPDDVFESEANYILMRGRLREFARIADLISSDRSLDYIEFTTPLFTAIDGQIAAPTGRANAVNLLALASRLPDRYVHADAVWRADFGLAMDCRAVALEAQKPEAKDAAAAEFHLLLDRYDREEGDNLGIGYCLYRAAPALGQDDSRPRILAQMRKIHAATAARIDKNIRAIIAHYNDNDLPDIAHNWQVRMPWEEQIAAPRELLLLDQQAYQNGLLSMLEASKNLDAKFRLGTYIGAVFVALWHAQHQY